MCQGTKGTAITADHSYTPDMLIEAEKIIDTGENFSGNETLDASGCYVTPKDKN